MNKDDVGRSGLQPSGSQASPDAPSGSSPSVSIPNADKVLLTGMGPAPGGGWEMGFRDGPESGGAIHIMAAGLAEMMGLDSDKPLNCIQVDVQPAGKPLLRLTMERAGGKSPLALKNEATQLLRQALEAMETERSEPLFIMRDAIRNWLEDQPASGTEARSGETACGLDPKDDGPAPEGRRP